MSEKLSDAEITAELGRLKGWLRDGNSLVKTYAFHRFADGIAFVQRLATAADDMDHHPDIDIRYTKIKVALSTHSAGGITALDAKLAAEAERVASTSV
jgi:4a-hydroxytetrahydrobiopterin dehydratase